VRTFSSFSAALLGESGPLARLLSLNVRLLEGVLSMMGGGSALTPLLVKLARRSAMRLGAGLIEELRVGLTTAVIVLAARLEEPRRFILPTLARARALVGNEFPEITGILTAVLGGEAASGPPMERAAQAVLGAVAFALELRGAQPRAAEAAQALGALRQNPRLTATTLDALVTELGSSEFNLDAAAHVAVLDSDLATAMTLQLRLMAEGMGIHRARTQAEVEPLLAGAQALILESPLPEGDVNAFVRALRAAPATARLPIFLVTSKEDPALMAAGLDAGADDVLTRPLNVDVLLAKLRRALGQQQASLRRAGPPGA
jgi:serine/threonine-protein kinase